MHAVCRQRNREAERRGFTKAIGDQRGAGPEESVRLASITDMRVTQKGQVTIPLKVRRALGITPGSEVRFELEDGTARLVLDRGRAAAEIARIRGSGDVELSTDEILALTRR